jgi:hypothetical protein
LLDLAREHDAGALADPAIYATFSDFLDVPEFGDYLILKKDNLNEAENGFHHRHHGARWLLFG